MRHAVRVVALACVVTASGGCSAVEGLTTSDFAQQEPRAVVEAASAAMSDLTSVRVTGQLRTNGVEMFVDISLDDDGRCAGTLRTPEGRVALRQIGRRAWFKGEESFFSRIGGPAVPQARLTHLSTSWVPLDPGPASGLCDLALYEDGFAIPEGRGRGAKDDELADELASELSDVELVEDDDLAAGVRAVHFSPRPDLTVWVLSEAPHHVVRIEQTGRDGGELALSDFGMPVEVERPAPDEVLRG